MGGGSSINDQSKEFTDDANWHTLNTDFVQACINPDEKVDRRWLKALVELKSGKIIVRDGEECDKILVDISLSERPSVANLNEESTETFAVVAIKGQNDSFWVQLALDREKEWVKALREEVIRENIIGETDLTKGLKRMMEQYGEMTAEEAGFKDIESNDLSSCTNLAITPPVMNIVILVVGTKGDVQPFIYLGQALQKDGHRVRLATHAEYRGDVTLKGGLEFYPLAGDPRKLSEYMVKTAGRLMPDLLNKEERTELPEKMKMLKDITYSCFPACTAPDPEDPELIPFVADAIISNPVSYGHIHCAEALCVPLHIMFPQPWSPTKCFPHPLSNIGFESKWSLKNYYSYKVVDEFMWLGLGSIINTFRKKELQLAPIRSGEHGDALLNDNKVPISHMWSPSFVPRCKDWPEYVDVVGEYRPVVGQSDGAAASAASHANAYEPTATLAAFLTGERPLYIGFGSMVIEDTTKLVDTIKAAAAETGYKVLLQSGWTKYADDYEMIADNVMVIGAMPHDFLFANVSGVCHHGGAGTTSAGLRAGNPTFICPFFGDQHFWAEMVHRSGAGPRGCPIGKLSVEKLVDAFKFLHLESTQQRAKELGGKMAAEEGVRAGVASFYKNLPIANMVCEVSIFDNRSTRCAHVFCGSCGLKLCREVDRVIHRTGSGRDNHVRLPFRSSRWGVVAPDSVIAGVGQGIGVAAYEMAGGLYDLFAKPIEGAKAGGVKGAAVGMATGAMNLFARPVIGGKVLIERVYTGTKGAIMGGEDHNSSVMVESKLVQPVPLMNFSTNSDKPVTTASRKIQPTATHSEIVEVVPYSVALDSESVLTDVRRIEEAYCEAMNFLQFWQRVDTDGNRSLDVKELTAFLGDAQQAEALLMASDANLDRNLTYTELAWVLAGRSISNK